MVVELEGQQQRARAGARRGGRGLGPGVAAADHDDVEALFHVKHPFARRPHFPMQKLAKISPRISSVPTRPTRASTAASAVRSASAASSAPGARVE